MTLRWVCPCSYPKHLKNTYKACNLKHHVRFLHSPAPQKVLKVRQNRINGLKVIISPPYPSVIAGYVLWDLLAFTNYNSAYSEAGPTWLAAVSAQPEVPQHASSPFSSHPLPTAL